MPLASLELADSLDSLCLFVLVLYAPVNSYDCYDIKPVRKEEGKSYWKIPLCDDDATREK